MEAEHKIEQDQPIQDTELQTTALILRPLFTEDEVIEIKEQWGIEKIAKDERLLGLQAEAIRLEELRSNERGQALSNIYDSSLPKMRAKLSNYGPVSTDDVLVIVRHALSRQLALPVISPEMREALLQIGDEEFIRLKLYSLVKTYFPSYHYAVAAAFPEYDLQLFELRQTPQGFWQENESKEKVTAAIRWIIEEKLGIEKTDPIAFRQTIKALPIQKTLGPYNLSRAIKQAGYNGLPAALIDAYPELKFKPWDLKAEWQGEDDALAMSAVKWLVEERLGLLPSSPDFTELLTQVNSRHFRDAGLTGLLSNPRFRSHIKLLIFTYAQSNISEADFAKFPRGWWNSNEGVQRATSQIRSLVERILGLTPDDPQFKEQIHRVKREDFNSNGLGGMLQIAFSNSLTSAIQHAYSDVGLHEWELGYIPRGFWYEENFANVGRAVRWMVEEKMGFSPQTEDFREKLLSLTNEDYKRYRLSSMIHLTGLKLLDLLKLAYPDLNIPREITSNDALTELSKFLQIDDEAV